MRPSSHISVSFRATEVLAFPPLNDTLLFKRLQQRESYNANANWSVLFETERFMSRLKGCTLVSLSSCAAIVLLKVAAAHSCFPRPFITPFKIKCLKLISSVELSFYGSSVRWHGGAVVSSVTSQKDDSQFESWQAVFSPHKDFLCNL